MRIIIIIYVCLLLSTNVFAQDDPSYMMGSDKGGNQQFEGFNLEGFTDDGEKSWDVEGTSADINGAEIALTDVNANTYGDSKMNVVAKNGMINQLSGKMELDEDVVITSDDGSQLTTNSLEWDREGDLVTTKDPVMINNERLLVTGTGLEARPGLSTTTIQEDVRVLVESEPEENDSSTVTITSVGPMTIDQIQGMARFEDEVVAVQKDQTLKADVLEVYFTEGMSGITKMICLGNVEVVQGENKTYARRADYDAITKKLVLSGRPKLILSTEGDDGFATLGN